MRNVVARSNAHALLLSIARRGARRRVTESDAIVAAWREHPARFALADHPEHPDAGRVRVYLSRLVHAGLLLRGPNGTLSVNAEGARAAAHGDLRARGPQSRRPRRADGAAQTARAA